MQKFWVEGVYFRRENIKKAGLVEPFARMYWAVSSQEALRLALEDLQGGEWAEPPVVSNRSEEQHMRSLGMPELPGFSAVKKGNRT
jgi:hypothetical protein